MSIIKKNALLPKNESKEHFELKQIATVILFKRGYKPCANEVGMSKYSDYLKDYKWFAKNAINKIIIDAVGVKGSQSFRNYDNIIKSKTMGIEAKVSYSDFINGFCCQCDYTYVIAPTGIIPIDKIPNKIGLIEIDLDNYSISGCDLEMKGIKIIKRAYNRMQQSTDKERLIYIYNLTKKISYSNTVERLFKEQKITLIRENR